MKKAATSNASKPCLKIERDLMGRFTWNLSSNSVLIARSYASFKNRSDIQKSIESVKRALGSENLLTIDTTLNDDRTARSKAKQRALR